MTFLLSFPSENYGESVIVCHSVTKLSVAFYLTKDV